jgi:hypothetical protein
MKSIRSVIPLLLFAVTFAVATTWIPNFEVMYCLDKHIECGDGWADFYEDRHEFCNGAIMECYDEVVRSKAIVGDFWAYTRRLENDKDTAPSESHSACALWMMAVGPSYQSVIAAEINELCKGVEERSGDVQGLGRLLVAGHGRRESRERWHKDVLTAWRSFLHIRFHIDVPGHFALWSGLDSKHFLKYDHGYSFACRVFKVFRSVCVFAESFYYDTADGEDDDL